MAGSHIQALPAAASRSPASPSAYHGYLVGVLVQVEHIRHEHLGRFLGAAQGAQADGAVPRLLACGGWWEAAGGKLTQDGRVRPMGTEAARPLLQNNHPHHGAPARALVRTTALGSGLLVVCMWPVILRAPSSSLNLPRQLLGRSRLGSIICARLIAFLNLVTGCGGREQHGIEAGKMLLPCEEKLNA